MRGIDIPLISLKKIGSPNVSHGSRRDFTFAACKGCAAKRRYEASKSHNCG